MDHRQLGRTGLDVSVIGLGTWQFGGEWGKRFSQAGVGEILARAKELGINLIDTAECYGDHLAESLIGPVTARARSDWIIATKFGHRFHQDRATAERWSPVDVRTDHWSPAEVLQQLDRSLDSLRTDYLDIYLFHSGNDEVFDRDDLWAALNDQVGKGKIRYLGISLGASDNLHQTARATEVGASVIEVTYNRLNRAAERAVFASCQEQGIGVLAREPLANGFLAGRYRPGTTVTDRNDWRSSIGEREAQDTLDLVERIRATEVPQGVPMAAWALAWCRQHPAISAVITGTRSIEQLESSANAVDLAIADAHDKTASQ